MTEWSDQEIKKALEEYNSGKDEPPYQGAVPDWFKLQATIQVDAGGLWWKGSVCEIEGCGEEASQLDQRGYRCDLHRV